MSDTARTNIAQAIRNARHLRGWSFEDLAKKAGKSTTPRTVRRIENRETCKLSSVAPILKALGLELVVQEKT